MTMKKLILSLLLTLGTSMPLLAQTYEELGEMALAAAEQDSLDRAEQYILQALKLDPANAHNAMLFSNLGIIQRRQRRYEKALESYGYALNYAPRSVPILLNRASLYLEMGYENHARVDYSMVLDVDADNREALLMRAYIDMQKRDYKSSRADYNRLLQLRPKSFNARLGLATLEQKAGNPEAALKLLNEMLDDRLDDDVPLGDDRLAMLYAARAGVEQELKQTDAALLDLEEAMRLDDSQAEPYLMRGQIYLDRKMKPQARRDFEEAMRRGVPQGDLRELLLQCK